MSLEYYFIRTPIGKLTIIEENKVVVYIGLPQSKLTVIKIWCKQHLNFINFTGKINSETNASVQINEYFSLLFYYS